MNLGVSTQPAALLRELTLKPAVFACALTLKPAALLRELTLKPAALLRELTLRPAVLACALTLLSTALSLTAMGPLTAQAQTTSTVTVNAGASLAVIPATDVGVNTAVWDANLLDTEVPALLTTVGTRVLRFPGGSTADDYNWQTDSIVTGQGGYANPANTFEAFMGVVQSIGAAPVITVNYGSNTSGNGGGTPALAASWVQYANVTKGYGVEYWEIGNEVYGNGEYGAAWETDLHGAHDPGTYGANVALFSAAMKAVDPAIKVGVVLAAPGYWPDGEAPNWNTNVLAQCGTAIDFVIVHWYPQNPGSESDADLLAAPESGINGSPGIAAMVSAVKALVSKYAGSNAANVQILVTEFNSVSSDPGKQTLSVVNALFIADGIATWLEQGVANVDVWDLHNGSTGGNSSSNLFGSSTFGDYGILSNASSGEPALDTPFATYYGLKMLTALGKPGDKLVRTTSSNSLLSTHAVLRANGELTLLLVNKDPSNTTTASVAVSGFTPASTGSVETYGKTSSAIASSSATGLGPNFKIAAEPYSLTTVVLSPAKGAPGSYTLAANPGTLALIQGASVSTTITVSPLGGFSGNVGFTVSGLPTGVTATFKPTTTTAKTSLTLGASSTASVGTSTVTIKGSSGGTSATTSVALTVKAGSGTPHGPAKFTGTASNSSAWFDEEDVELTTGAPITALTLTLTVAATNVTYGGQYETIGGQIAASHTSGSTIVYSFVLTTGQTISPGTYTFAAQMDGNGTQHSANGDGWTVTYATGGATYSQSGAL
jgi:hypothetical protein